MPSSPPVGSVADPAKVAAIHKGVTTQADLEREFGPPMAQGRDSANRPMLVWRYLQAQANERAGIPVAGAFLKSSDVRQQELKVSLDRAGRVAAVQIDDQSRQTNIFGQ